MKKLLLSLAIASVSISANAYQFEAGVNYADNDAGDATGVLFNYHFADVDTSKGPLNEANFLSKSSYVGGTYTVNDYVDISNLNGRFVFGADWTLELNTFNYDSDYGDSAFYRATIGKYINDHSEVFLGYAEFDESDAEEMITLGYKSVMDSFGYTVAATTEDGEYTLWVDAMYYINQSFGVGVGVAYDTESEETETIAKLSYFFIPGVELEVSYADESETVAAGVNFRF